MGCCAIISLIGVDAIAFALPVIWFYAFFDALNKNSLSADEFSKLEDDWLIIKNTDELKFNVKKVRIIAAVILILIGINSLYNGAISFCYQLGIDLDNTVFGLIRYALPKLVFSVLIIGAGIYLIKGKRKSIYEENVSIDNTKLDGDSEIIEDNFIITGVGGCVLKKKHIKHEMIYDDSFIDVAPRTDDLWLSKILQLSNTKIVVCPAALPHLNEISHDSYALNTLNNNEHKNSNVIMKGIRKFKSLFLAELGFATCNNDIMLRSIDDHFHGIK